MATVFFSLFRTALGDCGVAWQGDHLVATRLPDTEPAETLRRLARKTGGTQGDPLPAIQRAIESMAALLDGEPVDLTSIACDFHGVDAFARQVYAETRTIPAGQTLTYGAIAAKLGDKSLARDVGQALGRNPLPIVVPCHRVLGAGGKLTGFSAAGGVATKLKMLAIEGAQIDQSSAGDPTSSQAGLFDDLPLAVKPQS